MENRSDAAQVPQLHLRHVVTDRSRWPPLTSLLIFNAVERRAPEYSSWMQIAVQWVNNYGSRRLFVVAFALLHGMAFALSFASYHSDDNLRHARAIYGPSLPIARAAAQVLHIDAALVLFPICRNLVTILMRTPLSGVVPFDMHTYLHQMIAWSIVLFSWLHTFAHWVNFARLAQHNGLGFRGWVLANVSTGPGWSGYVMLICLTAMALTSLNGSLRANYERFWYTHHVFIIFFVMWSVHGAFCMLKPDHPPYCKKTGTFWLYWLYGGAAYLLERLVREFRGRKRTVISKVIQHPNHVIEIQIRKGRTRTRVGQYILLCCPEISLFQYHPFTLTNAPEEDFISIHMRCVGDFTIALATALGCDTTMLKNHPSSKKRKVGARQIRYLGAPDSKANEANAHLRLVVPRLYVDGPFGSASGDVFKYETVLLVGAGIGVTPFASILKSMWHRFNSLDLTKATPLKKVYFFWVCREISAFEWFKSLLLAIEAEDQDHQIEIHTYLTKHLQRDVMTNIMLHDSTAVTDTITGLRSPTNFGRPNWDAVFRAIRQVHVAGKVGVFCCGPESLATALQAKSSEYSAPDLKFDFGKENF